MELDYMNYPKFTPEMKKTHKILIPNMAPVQFRILAAAMEQAGYQCELLENCGSVQYHKCANDAGNPTAKSQEQYNENRTASSVYDSKRWKENCQKNSNQ